MGKIKQLWRKCALTFEPTRQQGASGMRYLLIIAIALYGAAGAEVLEINVGDTFAVQAFIGLDGDPETPDDAYDVHVTWAWPDEVEMIETTDDSASFRAVTPTSEPVSINVVTHSVQLDGADVPIIDVDNPDTIAIGHVPRTLRIRISGELEVEILD